MVLSQGFWELAVEADRPLPLTAAAATVKQWGRGGQVEAGS